MRYSFERKAEMQAQMQDLVNQYLAAGGTIRRDSRQHWLVCQCGHHQLSVLRQIRCRRCGTRMRAGR